MSNLLSFYEIIEKAIDSLSIPAIAARDEESGQWNFTRGSATIAVGIVSNERFPNGYFYVSSILMDVSEVPSSERLNLYQTLVEKNAALVNMKLCINNGFVVLISNRDATGLDVEEVATTIDQLSYYADLLDDKLIDMFIF